MTSTALAGAAFVVLGLGAASSAQAQLSLRGSDTLETVTKDAITAAGLGGAITYVGGGSGAGENAMIASPPTQHIAPMSRELNSATPDAVKCIAGVSQELLIGLDGIAMVTGSQTHGDSVDATPAGDDCSDTITGSATKTLAVPGCTIADGCSPDGMYTFATWQEVLAMVYGGQNHTTANGAATFAAAGISCPYSIVQPNNETGGDATCAAQAPPLNTQICFANGKCGDPTLVGKRNPARVNCASPVRQALVDNWGFLFSDVGNPPGNQVCRTGNCTKLRRAFRRDDLSGTTDTFVGLVGLVTIANPTKAYINVPAPLSEPIADRAAVANPFCNAGERPMNKGDSDYLDLDPIRRTVDHLNNGGTRFGQEQVAELVPNLGGANSDPACNTLATDGSKRIPEDHSSPTAPGIWPDPSPAYTAAGVDTRARMYDELGTASDDSGPLPAGNQKKATRLCLGLVLPVTLPANYQTTTQAYFGDPAAPATTVICDRGVTSSTIPDTRHTASLGPDGKSQGLTNLAVHQNLDGTLNFNCLSDQINAPPGGIPDVRVFNLHPVDVNGHYVVDNYVNPNIPLTAINAIRQARVVSAFYRIHTTRTTDKNGSIPTLAAGTGCNTLFDSTTQIGCLVKANTCDIGFAGREAVDKVAPLNNFAFRINGITASTQNIQNLVIAGASPIYPISRKLFLNSVLGFATGTAAEQSLFSFESTPASIDPIITARNFVVVPPSVTTRLKGCPATF